MVEFNAVDGLPGGPTLAVGNRGTVVHFSNGPEARYMASPTDRDLLDVHVGSQDFAVAVGPGIVLRWDGAVWMPIVLREADRRFSMVWATPDQGLILYGGRDGAAYRLCPHIPKSVLQPFCRIFNSPLRGACGHRGQVLLLLASGDLYRVNNALIGVDGGFEPAYRSDRDLALRSAWLFEKDCDPAASLPEALAIDDQGELLHFNGQIWQQQAKPDLRNAAFRALAKSLFDRLPENGARRKRH